MVLGGSAGVAPGRDSRPARPSAPSRSRTSEELPPAIAVRTLANEPPHAASCRRTGFTWPNIEASARRGSNGNGEPPRHTAAEPQAAARLQMCTWPSWHEGKRLPLVCNAGLTSLSLRDIPYSARIS